MTEKEMLKQLASARIGFDKARKAWLMVITDETKTKIESLNLQGNQKLKLFKYIDKVIHDKYIKALTYHNEQIQAKYGKDGFIRRDGIRVLKPEYCIDNDKVLLEIAQSINTLTLNEDFL